MNWSIIKNTPLLFFFILGTPFDLNVYDVQAISVAAEHSEPVVVRTTVAYKGICDDLSRNL